MDAIEELIQRLEKADGQDRELDGDICLALGWTLEKMKGDRKPYFRKPGVREYYMRSEPPEYTYSIDSALTLVPEGWTFGVNSVARDFLLEGQQPFCADVCGPVTWGKDQEADYPEPMYDHENCESASSAAIALCIAALKARARTATTGGEK